jgi:FSR family fosmidomycin resistance protein-like MFS transporter
MALYGLGMCFALLGSISVKLMPRLEIDEGKFGSLISVFMFSAMISSLIIGVVIDSVGYKPVAIIGFIFTALVIFLLARGKSYSIVMLACLLLGIGAMALNTAGNTLAPVVLFGGNNPAAASNLGNVFFGLGLFFTPLIVSFMFNKTNFENAVSILGIIALLPLIFAIPATYPASQAGFTLSTAFGLLSEPAVLLGAFVLFCYISLEISLTNWLPPFGKEVMKKTETDLDENTVDTSAARLLSYFAIAMMVGRLIASQIPVITQYGSWFIAIAALLSVFVILSMTVTKSVMQSRILAILAGLFFAPIFPTTVGVTFAKFSPEVYGSIFGIIFAVGLLGAVIVPKAIGNMAKGSSVQKGLRLLLPACIILVILAVLL